MSSPFESSSKRKRRDIDRFIPHSVSKNLYSMFEEAASEPQKKQKYYENILEENLLHQSNHGKVLNFTEDKADESSKENMLNL